MNRFSPLSFFTPLLFLCPACFHARAQEPLPGEGWTVVDAFRRPDSPYHGDGWESLIPGYWEIRGHALHRRLKNVGDKNPTTSFPWHWESWGRKVSLPAHRDISLPMGMIWRRDWSLKGNYTIRAEFQVLALPPGPKAPYEAKWRRSNPAYSLMGICFGGECLYESRRGGGKEGDASWMACWRADGSFGIYDHATRGPRRARKSPARRGIRLEPGDRAVLEVQVSGGDPVTALVTARLSAGGKRWQVSIPGVNREKFTDGYFGLLARGPLDFKVDRVLLKPGANRPRPVALNELHVCYALGDTLREVDGAWKCRFVAIFRNDGKIAQVRVADSPSPEGGWGRVPPAGSAPIVHNDFRLFTSSMEVTLPGDPSEKTFYYTVWKDGRDVTADPRKGFLGRKTYVGRLPRLAPPYKICGLGGHAIHRGGPDLPRAGRFQKNWVHDQPTPEAYKYFEDYGFQIIDWEDDVWYLELLFPPPSTDDAYKVITLTIAGPTTRWQMMRHWNVIHPGDHDYGMDDVKGPEQMAVRERSDLGQDPEYMRRNFKIVRHLVSGDEHPSGTENPKDWRAWRMPGGDFTLVLADARLWRDSQYLDLWVEEGWPSKNGVYDRTNPIRDLLGEEQFAWLSELIHTDPAPLICVTGINALHTLWAGFKKDPRTGLRFYERDRVAADYAGWVKAGADRVLRLFGSRPGVVTVYGDVHLASIVENEKNRLYECSFGPIGRSGARPLKRGFGPEMTDYDGRKVRVRALYHDRYGSPNLKPRKGPKPWNFLEMTFDPRGEDPAFSLKIRNLVDPPSAEPRGGGFVTEKASRTGRPPASLLPPLRTLPGARARLATLEGKPLCGTRTDERGRLKLRGVPDVPPGTPLVLTVWNDKKAESRVIRTLPPK